MQRIDGDGNVIKYYHIGGAPYNGLRCIDGKLYAFDENGEPYDGLTEINGKAYYADPSDDHVLKKNADFEIDGKKYHADSYGNVSEALRTGLYKAPDGYSYYYTEDGKKVSARWITLDGNEYYFQPVTGRMLVSESAVIDGVGYVFNENGIASLSNR